MVAGAMPSGKSQFITTGTKNGKGSLAIWEIPVYREGIRAMKMNSLCLRRRVASSIRVTLSICLLLLVASSEGVAAAEDVSRKARSRPADAGARPTIKDVWGFVAETGKGYVPRPCGLDMNRNGRIGEPADRLLGDGKTADPDGDGVAEDIFYVDANNGDDTAGDGSAAKPFRTIQKALDSCDGPGDGAEDIVCISGVFREELRIPRSGVAGHYVHDGFQFPKNPLMIVGWDKDGDGRYPPFDKDDVAVLDGTGGLSVAISNMAGLHSYVEIAHLTIREYTGKNHTRAVKSGRGVLRLAGQAGNTKAVSHIYMHDVEMKNINYTPGYGSSSIVVSFWTWPSPLTHIAIANSLAEDMGYYFARGAPQAKSGHFRFQNLTLKYRSSSDPKRPTIATGFKMWGPHSDVEILDCVFDSQVDKWKNYRYGQSAVSVHLGTHRYTVRGNVMMNMSSGVGVNGYTKGYEVGRTVDDAVIDRNLIVNMAPAKGGRGIVIRGGHSPKDTVEDVAVTDNFMIFDVDNTYGISTAAGNTQGPQPGTITITGNRIYGPQKADRFTGVYIFNRRYGGGAAKMTYPQQRYVFKNNIVAAGKGHLNVRLDYMPKHWTAAGNVYDDRAVFTRVKDREMTFDTWRSATGQDGSSRTESRPLTKSTLIQWHRGTK